jgi:heat shock protein HslJ
MSRRIAALIAILGLTFAACGEPGDAGSSPTTPPTDAPSVPDQAYLSGSRWLLVSILLDGSEDAARGGTRPTLEFGDALDRLGGTAGCNLYFGSVAIEAPGEITIDEIGSTLMWCDDDGVMDQEQRFLEALGRVDRMRLTGDRLVLESSDGTAVIVLEPAPEVEDRSAAGTWSATTIVVGEAAVSIIAGTRVEVTIDLETGAIYGNAGCNSFGGEFIVVERSGSTWSVEIDSPFMMTEMWCGGDGVMDQEQGVIGILSDAVTFATEGDALTIATADGRALVLEPVPVPEDRALAGEWLLTTIIEGEMASSTVGNTEPRLFVDPDAGRLSGDTGCNTFFADAVFTAANGSEWTLEVSPPGSTKMYCDGVMEQERIILGIVEDAVRITVEGDRLTITTADGRSLIFEWAGERVA